MPRFLEMERRDRSLILSMWRAQRRAAATAHTGSGARWSLFVSLDDGMQTLVDRLAQSLPEGVLRLRSPLQGLERRDDVWHLRIDGADLVADAVVLATPAHRTASFVEPLSAPLARDVAGIPYSSSATVSVAF